MSFLSKAEAYYLKVRSNRWHWFLYLFCRLALAYAFIFAGIVKILGERFASGLSPLHPMGAYLEALHQTGFYYTFIGIAQLLASILLLIPRTVALGALLYLPIIVNIWLLSFAVRFEGSLLTSPLMVLANLYILAWHYDKWRYLLPFKKLPAMDTIQKPEKYSLRFPFAFFGMVVFIVSFVVSWSIFAYEVKPRNSLKDCRSDFLDSPNQEAGFSFCDCIHQEGNPLDLCLERYEEAKSNPLKLD